MASTRSSTTTQRHARRETSTQTSKAALTTLARRGASVQIAAFTAAAAALTGWPRSHLPKHATLPGTAADHFDARVGRVAIDN
jgi:hypothetical protein